ncbi:hypothetical protein [Actinoallomurus soli]|uniref:hypothetical protein n=1 Tax=Actinoallomurus soli TaxID=2952535 RepID=UPI002092CB5B|nr:hypothetical protein [Actinoallomurus soli]MCO5971853.1 hypothetical protein [Actinoallomurus soli]
MDPATTTGTPGTIRQRLTTPIATPADPATLDDRRITGSPQQAPTPRVGFP